MQTIIVEITVPAISLSFDFRIPSGGRVYDVTNEIINILETTQQNLMFDRENPMLYDADSNAVLDPSMRICDTNLHDSSRLILV